MHLRNPLTRALTPARPLRRFTRVLLPTRALNSSRALPLTGALSSARSRVPTGPAPLRAVASALMALMLALTTVLAAPAGAAPVPPDTSPPTQPTGLRDNCIADFPGTAFCWNASTDDVGVTGYDVYRVTATGPLKVGTTRSTMFTEGNLVTGQYYTYYVIAKDAAGNLSPQSDPVRVLARQGMPVPVRCQVVYTATTWSTGMVINIRITNTGTFPINGWTLRFTFPSPGQRITPPGYGGQWYQPAQTVTITNTPWNATIPIGASIYVGANGTHTGSNPNPTSFTLNNIPCSVG